MKVLRLCGAKAMGHHGNNPVRWTTQRAASDEGYTGSDGGDSSVARPRRKRRSGEGRRPSRQLGGQPRRRRRSGEGRVTTGPASQRSSWGSQIRAFDSGAEVSSDMGARSAPTGARRSFPEGRKVSAEGTPGGECRSCLRQPPLEGPQSKGGHRRAERR